MKKLLLALAAVLVCAAAIAQKEQLTSESKGFLYVAAGPALPLGAFADDSPENEEAGMAKTGFTINLHGGYYMASNFGLKATGFYTRHGVKDLPGMPGGVDMGHWQYYGLTVGPMYRVPMTYNMDLTLAAQVGVANAGTPQVKFQGQELMKDDWSITMPLKGEAALHFLLGDKAKLIVGADYLYMKPKFDVSARNESGTWVTQEVKQKMGVVNLFAGVGISF
jgi:hypothetical protein